jgi:hypothetical protein
MHWMSVKLPDNFQIHEHSWPCLFHINHNEKLGPGWFEKLLKAYGVGTKILLSMSEKI